MDSSKEEILLQKIEELVVDEDKIVTNSIVCEKFDLSLVEAKRILEKYVSDENISPGKISATYVISGKLKTGEYCIQIVDSIVLKERRKLFCSISNELVYSVQKSNTIDLNTIALIEKTDTSKTTVLKGSIVGEKCIERVIKSKVLPPPPPQKNFEKQKPSSFFKPVVKTGTNGEKKASEPNPINSTQNKTQNQKKIGSLAGFLSQSSKNSNTENKQQLKKTLSSDEDTRETKRPRLETSDCELSKVDVKVENEDSKVSNGDIKSNISTKEEKSEQNKNVESKENKPFKKASNKKKQDGKKRKRIIVESDSEDDLFANDEEEEKIDIDVEDEKPIATQPKEIIPKNKRRKAVEKVYTDDEGFVVTKTEYVLVSASEDEEAEVKDEKPKLRLVDKEEKKSPPQKATAKAKKGKKVAANQTTLMSFFTKK